MAIVIIAADGSRTPLAAFSFVANGITSGSLTAGSGSSSVPNTNPLFGGSSWFGFSSAVDPFLPPVLEPGEFTAFQFTLEVAQALVPLALEAQFAGGEGAPDGTPIFTGAHPAQYFTAANRSVVLIASLPAGPAPAPTLARAAMALALAVLSAVGLAALARRRRGPLEKRLTRP